MNSVSEVNVVLNTDIFGRRMELKFADIKQKTKKLVATAAICATTGGVVNAQAVKVMSNEDVYFKGNVGIGTPTPAYKLDVNGAGRFGNNNLNVILGTCKPVCSRPLLHSETFATVYSTNEKLLFGTPSNWAYATFSKYIYTTKVLEYNAPTNVSICYFLATEALNPIRLYETPEVIHGGVVGPRGDTISEKMRYVFNPEELQAVFPQLVTVYDTCDGGEPKYAIDYTGMVPILTAAVNEQHALFEAQQGTIGQQQLIIDTHGEKINQHQTEIGILQQIIFGQEFDLTELLELRNTVNVLQNTVEDLQNMVNLQNRTIEELRRVILICCENTVSSLRQQDSTLLDSNSYNNRKNINNNIDTNSRQNPILNEPVLYQNIPNPFSSNTEITCYVPEINTNAIIYIYNLQGTELMSFPITKTGFNTVSINASTLPAGMYLYTLVVDNVIIDSKRMILTK